MSASPLRATTPSAPSLGLPRALSAALLLLAIAGCGRQTPPAPTPKLPRPPLQSRIGELQATSATWPEPAEATRRDLRELADVALQRTDADARTRNLAERALLDHVRADWALEPALADGQIPVRRRAAWLCGRSGQTVLQLPLLLRLKYELDPETVVWVADALLRLGNDTGLAWLDAAIQSSATAEQAGAAAIEALRARQVTLSPEPTWAEIQTALRERHAAWLATGVSSLPNVPPPEPVQLGARLATHLATTQGTLLRPVDDARYVMTRAGQLAVPLLRRAIGAEEPYLRTMALQVLGSLGTAAAAAAPDVMPLLGDPLTASYAMRTLGELGATQALPALRTALLDPDSELRSAATQALGLLRDAPSVPALRERLRDAKETMDVRVGAAFALRCFGEDAEAEAFLAERADKKDYHEPTLTRLRERLVAPAPK